MNVPLGQHKILPFHLSAPVMCLLAVVLVAAWVGVHWLKRRTAGRTGRLLLLPAGMAVGFVAILAVMAAMQNWLTFATNWWIWPLALVGAVMTELLLLLYELERRIVPPRLGLAVAALRVALALVVVGMLSQPVRSVEFSRSLQRYVAVLVDDSPSMQVPDKQMTAAERIRLAEVLLPEPPKRPWQLERAAQGLREAREELAPHTDWFASLREASPEARLKQLEGRRAAEREALDTIQKAIAGHMKDLMKPLDGSVQLDKPSRAALVQLNDQLTTDVQNRLAQVGELLARDRLPGLARDPDPLLARLRQASAALVRLEPRVVLAGEALDQAFYASLPDAERARIDAVAARLRFAIARDLIHGAGDHRGLLEDLQGDYGVRLYTFASKPVEVDIEKGLHQPRRPSTATPVKTEEGSAPAPAIESAGTNLAAALEKVLTEMPADRMAGIVVLSDGQHNAPDSVEPLARRIGLQQVPVCSIVFGGGAKPTTDAAIVALEAPETVYKKDKIYLNADLKLDGLAGRTVRVTLYDGDDPVDSEEVAVEADTLRTRVQLADEPDETGLHAYRVKVEDLEGEVLTTNNEHPLSVSVSDDQTRLLLIDGRPRWEFRYVKNLFASRDRTVKLQYVLLHPDEIPGQKPRPKVHASAARAKDEPEATAPPENEAEWMKFDVIVLGDVEPEVLRKEDLEAIRKFVHDRAGTLIVVAGPCHMPHAYANTPLADLLPVTFPATEGADSYMATPEETFRVALTPEGRQHVVTRLRVDTDENLETWASMPAFHWRHPVLNTKEGATVLAYALPPTPPDFFEPKREHEVPDEATLRKRQEFIRERALISTHNVALGRVMFLALDRTWRLRYRVGDTHHHRFWGQVLRWATADKLPAGTNLVKIGTDRPRYSTHDSVRVRVKMTDADYSPVVSTDVTAVVSVRSPKGGERTVLRKKVTYVPNSLGIYTGDLGTLDGGSYRVRVESPDAKKLVRPEDEEKVVGEFFVEPTIPREQVELSANRGLLERMATLTNGRVDDPAQAGAILKALGPGTLTHREIRRWALWDSWPLLVVIIGLAAAEWLLRKRGRLA